MNQSDESDSDSELTKTIKAADPTQTISPSVEDSSGKAIKVGSLVKTLSLGFVKKSLPSSATEAEASRLADKRAIVHDISGDKIYIEIIGGNLVCLISPSAVVLQSDGIRVSLSDGTRVGIGSFVQIKKFTKGQDPPWPLEKQECCGRTGKIVRIKEDEQILVQFAWGSTLFYTSSDLLQSDQTKVQTKDSSDPSRWLTMGNLVHLSDSQQDFLRTQRKNRLPSESAHAAILGRYVTIKKILIRAFSPAKVVQVTSYNSDYLVNSEILTLIDAVDDSEGNKVRCGDKVKLVSNAKQVQTLQSPEYGGWNINMEKLFGIVGHVTEIGISGHTDDPAGTGIKMNCLCVKIKFYDGSYYFNPKAIRKVQGQGQYDSSRLSELMQPEPWGGTIVNTTIMGPPKSVNLEMIDRQDLDCFEILGQGSFGSVCRGTWRHKSGIRYRVAIKKIKLENVKLETILKEANIQFSLDHPNIVKLFGVHQMTGEVGNREFWMVMNLVDGDDLFSLIFKDPQPHNVQTRRMTFGRKIQLCKDMCHAISYIHYKRYLHCDIKPHNMMIDRNSGTLYVCDFGITRVLGDMDAFMTKATQYTGGISGTLAYIPPECFQQDPETSKYKRPTEASDIWALGVVFYELFAERLFCESWLKLLQNIATNNEDYVRKQIDNVPEPIRQMSLRTLNFSPKFRPTAQELYEYFQEF